MHLALVGMSGSGKSFWSRKLAEHGFLRLGCDDLIASRLTQKLARPFEDISEVGRWMGFPFEPQYRKRAALYFSCELEVMEEKILVELHQAGNTGQMCVVDTTGSVIYTGRNILERLRNRSRIIHLATPPYVQNIMLESYLKEPRPVLWQKAFNRKPGETNEEALSRCYPVLLKEREKQYRQLAHVSINYNDHKRCLLSAEDFLVKITKDTRVN